jgi:hypothetical protein
MSEPTIYRLRYPAIAVFLLGGILGSAVNVGVSSLLYFVFKLNPIFAFFCGTLFNQLFHYVYYHLVFFNQEIRNRMSFPLQLLMYVCVAAIAIIPFRISFEHLQLNFVLSVLATIALLSMLNVVLIRI